jgi:hypothetical protein
MHSAPLPRGTLQNRLDGTFEAPMGVAAQSPTLGTFSSTVPTRMFQFLCL